MSHKVLIIDDEAAIRDALTLSLKELSCEVTSEADGARGLVLALENDFDIAIIDVGLPSMNGYDICRKLREAKSLIPILMLTSRSTELDVVLGLEQGADDYLVKPFRQMELVARIRALLRRSEARRAIKPGTQASADLAVLRFPSLTINLDSRIVTVVDETVELTALEFDVLAFLAEHLGKTVSRDALVEAFWGGTAEDIDSSMNTILSRLRKKLSGIPEEVITTVRGVGYRFALEREKVAKR